MLDSLLAAAFVLGWVGHACLWTALLNILYSRPLPKGLLRWWRHLTALILLAFPLLVWSGLHYLPLLTGGEPSLPSRSLQASSGCEIWSWIVAVYVGICLVFGGVVFPVITAARAFRPPPPALVSQTSRTLDLWPEHGRDLIGEQKLAVLARLPGNGVFRVEFTDLTLALPSLPAPWEGLTILVLSDLHFQGTPSRRYFERIIDDLAAGPPPDVVCLLGDVVDSDVHHSWIQPLLGRLPAREARLAILGNHDLLYDPDRVRAELAAAGYAVLGNGWRELTIHGVRCLAIGHEGPWFTPGPDMAAAPTDCFRLCLSHTPDNFYWARGQGVRLMLCGHVHGGGIRVPVIGPIFVPSAYGRRFDSGVFQNGDTIMVVSRGLSGREPLRLRCDPQVIRIRLVRGATPEGNAVKDFPPGKSRVW